MKFLQALAPARLVAALVPTPNNPRPQEQQDCLCTYEEAEAFMVGLRRVVAEEEERRQAVRCRVELFERIEVEPHYLESISPVRLLEFEFHLGVHAFPERTEALHSQLTEIAKAMRLLTRGAAEALQNYFLELEATLQRTEALLGLLGSLRSALAVVRERRELRVGGLVRRRARVKEKAALLKKVKAKNEAAFQQITNLDQAFATEQPRVKLYRKLSRLTELDRSKYIGTFRSRLVATSRGNKALVEAGLREWVQGGLSEKQVEKLVFMVYFMEKEEVYRDHQIRIDFASLDRPRLRQEINKIFAWNNFHYMREAASRERIHEFLHFLLTRIE